MAELGGRSSSSSTSLHIILSIRRGINTKWYIYTSDVFIFRAMIPRFGFRPIDIMCDREHGAIPVF